MADIEQSICLIRGQKVMLDSDLAGLYGVPTKAFNQAVKRNLARFPEDFMFELTPDEAKSLRSQFVTLEIPGRGRHPKYAPFAFTEHGVAMLSNLLRSDRAVKTSVMIVRAFIRLRELVVTNKELANRIGLLEEGQWQHASVINQLADEIGSLKALPDPGPRRPIGFHNAT